ncbi:carbohydrate deacetylase [Halochromatium roseum]|uniref:carbohydrate deacetylase n=1 Tax=Halochromatium roseum TaxID=391920 RepID=UPI0019142E65|nr:ChbG/HpnK family deacetylase [Halochromatium roseum]MBK5940705.1 hypothetical protein [Halochromatium roseum]
MNALRLIVHADDLGLSESVNAGILEAHQDGLVTASSIMANGTAFDDAVRCCRATPSLDLGIHLTLTEERPLCDPADIPSLVDDDGRLHRHAVDFTRRYLSGRIASAEVAAELDAQVRRVLDTGLPVSHLDSHQHLHLLPQVWEIAAGLARRYHIPAIRCPLEPLKLSMFSRPRLLSRAAQLVVLNRFAVRHRDDPMVLAKHFRGFFFGGRLTASRLVGLLQRLPASGVCELMCHPGQRDLSGEYSHWGYQWEKELAALKYPLARRLLDDYGIALTSYADLVQSMLDRPWLTTTA